MAKQSEASFSTQMRFLDGTDVPADYVSLVRYYIDGALEAETFFTLDELELEAIR